MAHDGIRTSFTEFKSNSSDLKITDPLRYEKAETTAFSALILLNHFHNALDSFLDANTSYFYVI